MTSSLEKRLSKLEMINAPDFLVRFPDKDSKPGEETYNNTPKPDGLRCCVDLTLVDMGNL